MCKSFSGESRGSGPLKRDDAACKMKLPGKVEAQLQKLQQNNFEGEIERKQLNEVTQKRSYTNSVCFDAESLGEIHF